MWKIEMKVETVYEKIGEDGNAPLTASSSLCPSKPVGAGLGVHLERRASIFTTADSLWPRHTGASKPYNFLFLHALLVVN
jgi:hypothetical protein